MGADDLLRRYLEQRRDLGESELVLDRLTVDEVMRLIGARKAAGAPVDREQRDSPPPQRGGHVPASVAEGMSMPEQEPGTPTDERPAAPSGTESSDWRQALRSAGAQRPEKDVPPARPIPRADDVRPPALDARGERARAERPGDAENGGAPRANLSGARAELDATGEIPSTRGEAGMGTSDGDRAGDRAMASKRARGAGGAEAVPAGIVVGSSETELFGGPIGEAASLEEIAKLVSACQRCDLYRTATMAVPGEGSPNAGLMCVGEAPGANEDATGRPFVGQAGQLLTKILAAIDLKREDVFIANVLKHRPPGNRNPLPEEVDACRPYLVRQVELIRPKVIIAFGTFAAQTLLDTKLTIGKLRGLVHRYHGVPVIVTYHPAALLRNPAWKRPTWEDVQLARRILDSANA